MKKLTTSQFVERAKNVHGNKYDYSKSVFRHRKTKIAINCKIHGIFFQDVYSHLAGKGCCKCAGLSKITTDEFIKRAKQVHQKKYKYFNTVYDGMCKKVKITCPTHGDFFQKAQGHLLGKGCRKCKYDKHKILTRSNIHEFTKKAVVIHKNKYDYLNSDYVNSVIKINIVCNKCKHSFYQSPHDHLDGHGCPYCPHKISKPELLFLELLNIPNTRENRQKHICGFRVDGVRGNKIYEFLGDYYHGNPKLYNPSNYNQICHKTFGELYENTKRKLSILKNSGYRIYYIWESEWNKWNSDKTKTFPINLVSQQMIT